MTSRQLLKVGESEYIVGIKPQHSPIISEQSNSETLLFQESKHSELKKETTTVYENRHQISRKQLLGCVNSDDDDEYEEGAEGNRLLGFMFGNVDGSGDLDVDYLDEDAKEHLSALADELGSSLTEIDLSVQLPCTPSDAADQEYDEKAEDAVDYEDIDEQYEGPEVHAATEEDYLRKNYFSKEVSASTLENAASIYDDDNYDDNEDEKQHKEVENSDVVQPFCSPGEQINSHEVLSQEKDFQEDILLRDALDSENLDADMVDIGEEEQNAPEEPAGDGCSATLPILCVEDGMVILKFSDIFGIHEPLKKAVKRDRPFIIPKERPKPLDACCMVEEDEEIFLKESWPNISGMRESHVIKKEIAVLDDVLQSEDFLTVQGNGKMASKVDHRKDSCFTAEPMKEDSSLNTSTEWSPPSLPQLYPLDQQDWEDKIIWNNSPSSSDVGEICELSGPDSESLADKERDLEDEAQAIPPEPQSELYETNHGCFLRSCSVSVEPFGSENFSGHANLSFLGRRYHPQLLRLESRLDMDDPNADFGEDGASKTKLCGDTMRRFSNLTLQNRDIVEGTWLDNIVWEPHQSIAKPKLILDLQDEQMLFELLDNKNAKNLWLHAGAMVIARSVTPSHGDSLELHGHGGISAGRFNIANDKFYPNRISSQQRESHSKKGTDHKNLHSVPGLKLQTMKVKLSNKDIANFHRPKALWYPHDIEVALNEQEKLPTQGPMKVLLKSLGGKGSKLHVDAEETILSVKAKASKKLDFKLSEPVKIFFSGMELEDHKSLAEQNVCPNSVLHLICTKIHLLPRAQKLPGENRSLRPPGAFKKKSDLSVKDGHVFLMEYCEERPLLLGNAGMGSKLCTYYQKSTPGDQMGNMLRNENLSLGSVRLLDPADKSPFLGDIKPGCSQSCLETNMYRAPIFLHKVPSTDYLLVRSAKGKLSIRRIDRIDVVGQQEPHMEVMSPAKGIVQSYNGKRLLVYVYREFHAAKKRGLHPSIRTDELSALFPSFSEAVVRKQLKNIAFLQRGPNGQPLWFMRRNSRIPSEETLRRLVSPEDVCAYESMQAGQYRLRRLGITRLTHPAGLSPAMNQLPDEAIALAAASHIERELQITPWNLSSNFVACTKEDEEKIERLEITGVGDPSGRGLGFSYVRVTPKAPISNAMVKKKTVVGKGSTVTGTDADLRRLSMEAARELLLKFKVPEEQIAKQTRWHRIALIRKLSSEQAASGVQVDRTTTSKFARGQRMSFLQLQQQTREKCQEIWDRQVQSLCTADGDENESESEANSDMDSFAGDLENLLDAEEGEEDEEDERKKKKKERAVGEQVGLASKLKFGHESSERIKKNNTVVKKITQSEGSHALKEIINKNQKESENFSARKNLSAKVKTKRKNDNEQMGLLHKKVKILGEGMRIIKEKKSARESFVCGACGQLGHMRTNKNCPKYGEDSETRIESMDPDKALGKPNYVDQVEPTPQKIVSKKLIQKSATKIAVVEAQEDDRPSAKAKILKVKCGSTDKLPDKLTPAAPQIFDKPVKSDAEMGHNSVVKVNKIIFSNKTKPEDVQVESHKPSIVIRPPMEGEREQPQKKIIIKQPKEIINVDEISQEGSVGHDSRKMKKIIELSSLDKHREHESRHLSEGTSRMRSGEDMQWWEEKEKRITVERHKEERERRAYVEKMTMFEEKEKLAELTRYQETIRREWEEERQKAKTKKKKKKRPDIRDNYLDDLPPRRNDRRIPERERLGWRRPTVESGRYTAESAPLAKRRRGGEVGLANILESIVETLKDRKELSYLFLKPVSKKEAPNYLDIIEHPMDLSTMRDKARRLQYKSREEFRHDMYQIAFNAHRYNDRWNPGIPPLADQLLELCDHLLDVKDAELTEVEAGIEYVDN
ncbi:Transcription initiation factor TFIID subunit 1 [Forsythia ovata]|uniref:Transcription initiation factor TFIID subunit 1 n=1 Tax=Forsythia ovata TaxID=205694 RepID=A0ABD1P4K2_9LAMI